MFVIFFTVDVTIVDRKEKIKVQKSTVRLLSNK